MARGERALAVALSLLSAASCGGDADSRGPRRPTEAPPGITLPPRDGPSPVCFIDATAEAGITFVQDNGYGGEGWFYVESLGSGVVFFDADGDEIGRAHV